MPLIPVKVLRKKHEARDIASFELVAASGSALPRFSAGAHIDVHIPGGFVRQYSLSNSPDEGTHYRIAVLREQNSRGGSLAMHDAVHEQDTLLISEPRNHFPLVKAGRTLLFAGGIGITPILAMAQILTAGDADFDLHYCCKSRTHVAFFEEMSLSAFAARVHFHFDDGDTAQRLDLAQALGLASPDCRIYACGPAGFIDFVVQGALMQGWSKEQLHVEYFAAQPHASEDHAFDVQIASTRAIYRVSADETVVQSLARNGITISVSCEQGVCGTCITRVLQGECDHRDLYFTDVEKLANDQFTPCCSRAKSNLLVLDL